MRLDFVRTILIILGATIFQLIFWEEKLGINAIIFDVFVISSIFYLYPSGVNNTITRWILAGHLLSAAMLIINNTGLAIIAFSTTLLLFVSFSQYFHRSIMYASGSLLLNYVFAVPNIFKLLMKQTGKAPILKRLVSLIRILLIPGALLFIFFIIYAISNTVFANWAEDIIESVAEAILRMFDLSFLPRFMFFLFAVIVTTGLIVKTKYTYFSESDKKQNNNLSRKKYHLKKWQASVFSDLFALFLGKISKGMLALKNEFKTGLISLVLLNILLLIINIIDIKYVWFGSPVVENKLASSVHQGAGSLIFSIVLAMVVVLVYFRGNLNFYKQSNLLRYAAYAWIFQNLILVISVFLRDYYYISHFGLAYKRLALLFYLVMVIVGLITVFIKIWKKRTAYYLVRINSWALVIIVVTASIIDWDYVMAKYNLERGSKVQVDVPFLLSLSNSTLPLIEKHKQILEKDNHLWHPQNSEYRVYNAVGFFEKRKTDFFKDQRNYTWLSWNVADDKIEKRLKISNVISMQK